MTQYNVAPRYTPGSPGLVDAKQARRVAVEEYRSYQHVIDGLEGLERQQMARAVGLSRIVYTLTWVGKWMIIEDVITGDKCRVPAKLAERRNWYEGYTDNVEYWTGETWRPLARRALV